MEVMSENEHFLPTLLRIKGLLLGGAVEMGVGIYCRAGEKRSVALAAFVAHIVRELYGVEVETAHLSDWFWRFRTCQGKCEECTLQPRRRRDAVLFDAVANFHAGGVSPAGVPGA